jgi:peptidylprolyl isomerase
MKLAPLVLLAAAPLAAQSPSARPASHTTTHTATRTASAHTGCVTVPELSPKIPALPAGAGCPKALYTLSTLPSIKLDYASPLEGEQLRETLGLTNSSFTLAYVDTKAGSGPLAQPHKWYTIHYTGYLTDGTKFDSSLDRNEPISIEYGKHMVILGWDTGFAGMHIGGKRRLYIPYELAYGPSGRPPTIPAKAELIFDVELVAQSDTEPKPQPKPDPGPQPEPKPGAIDTPAAGSGTGSAKHADSQPANPQ